MESTWDVKEVMGEPEAPTSARRRMQFQEQVHLRRMAHLSLAAPSLGPREACARSAPLAGDLSSAPLLTATFGPQGPAHTLKTGSPWSQPSLCAHNEPPHRPRPASGQVSVWLPEATGRGAATQAFKLGAQRAPLAQAHSEACLQFLRVEI